MYENGKPALPIQPLHDFVVVRMSKPGETESGIALPEDSEVVDPKGTVVAAGPGRFSDFQDWKPPCPVKVGDVVYLHNSLAMQNPNGITVNGEPLLVVRYRDLMAIESK